MLWFPGKPLDSALFSGGVVFKSAPSPPPVPDPTTVANAQGAANAQAVDESAKINQVNQVTPYGSQTWSGDIGSPNRTVTTSLNPTAQQTFDQQQQLAKALTGDASSLQGQVGQITSTPFSLNGITPLPTSGDLSKNLQDVQNAVYSRNTQYLDPQFSNAQHDLDNQLANQGIPVGSDAWTRAENTLGNQRQQAYSDARDAAIQAGNSAQAQEFGIGQGTQQQEISNMLLSRQEPMNELAAILQGSPAISSPNFAAPAQYQVSPADVTGAYGLSQSAQNAAYQGGVSSANSGNQAAAGLAAAAATAAAIF